jgi:hypothetical protein
MSTQQVRYCENMAIIDVWEDGNLMRIIYVHRAEYRSWDA